MVWFLVFDFILLKNLAFICSNLYSLFRGLIKFLGHVEAEYYAQLR